MRKTIRKWFWVWDFDKEEQWLNEMAAKGLCLISVGWCRYDFEDCIPGEYIIRLELLDEMPMHPESVKYIEFLEDTGAEHIASWLRWIYIRKKKIDGEFQLYSDRESRIRHLSRIIRFIGVIAGLNWYFALYNLFLFFMWHYEISLLSLANLAIGVLSILGVRKLWNKRKKLKEELQVFE